MHHISRKPVAAPIPSTVPFVEQKQDLSLRRQYSSENSILPHSPPKVELFPTLEIPTVGPEISSGFPYNQRLFELHIAPDEWTRFSNDVAHAARLTTLEKYAVWSVGLSIWIVASGALAVLGAVPGYYAGKGMKNSRVAKKVRRSLKGKGELETTLSTWNENIFRDKGFRVWLRLPKQDQEKLQNRLEGGNLKRQSKEGDDNDDRNDTASACSTQPSLQSGHPLSRQSDSKPGFKVEPKESVAARRRREKLEAKRLEKHYTLMVEDIRKPIGQEEILEFGVIEIEDTGSASTASSVVSSPQDPPEYESIQDNCSSMSELGGECLSSGAALRYRGIHELEA
ncbi:uncharacterized protein PADG_05593 [Paracoccidioides brasiliensis Pb18]|uniref:Uncharacterized protein n=1 Tax=Paracoccidioides brasiliensis (strain Pb18) TaxID=502780 RepID=C1GEA7_PARBD|nr:uncharacterized protein PADG_05593 [Paracoccidioides brasiliensis Pb18]EEH49514.1 hypothetical protein PADG_05593 [Paracoccidioides brasiliensis Pb18]